MHNKIWLSQTRSPRKGLVYSSSSSPPAASSPFLAFFLFTRPALEYKSWKYRRRQNYPVLPATTEWRLKAEVDVLLRVEADHEGGDVDNLGSGDGVVSLACLQTSLSFTRHWLVLKEFVMVHDSDNPLVIDHVIKVILSSTHNSHTCFLTRICLCLIRTLAWWMDLASPSLKTYK